LQLFPQLCVEAVVIGQLCLAGQQVLLSGQLTQHPQAVPSRLLGYSCR
jgi:hypothetical protein